MITPVPARTVRAKTGWPVSPTRSSGSALLSHCGMVKIHGDNGAGIGASHQTGWTGLVATLIELFRSLDAAQLLEAGKKGGFPQNSVSSGGKKETITR